MEKINRKPDRVFSPQPMFVIGTKNENGTPNFGVITWIGFSFDKTPHIMMTIGGTKRTKTNILRERKFSANMITEDNLWLADYFGCTKGEEREKNDVSFGYTFSEHTDVPVIDECHWAYECEVTKVIELGDAHLFLAEIKNIQIDKQYETMDMQKIDLEKTRPVIYAPYNYFSIGQKLGEVGEWREHLNMVK